LRDISLEFLTRMMEARRSSALASRRRTGSSNTSSIDSISRTHVATIRLKGEIMPINAMTGAAAASRCTYTPFSQVQLLDLIGAAMSPIAADAGGSGICFGLAVAWLEQKIKGEQANFVAHTNAFQTSPIASRSHLFWRNQNDDMWKKLAGLSAAKDEEGSEKTRLFDMSEGAAEFTNWLAAARGTRYFMVGVPGHAMAAYGSRTGTVAFFDPNAGIVSSMSSSRLAACLSAYFAVEKIKNAYKRSPQNRVVLDAKKFKAVG
jgi:hypothetical protein